MRFRLVRLMGVSRTLLLLVICVAAARLNSQQPAARTLTIAAASDLQPAASEIGALFKKQTGTEVSVTYGASGSLYAQISNGAPFDVFLSADFDYPRNLIASGNAVAGSFKPFARGELVLCLGGSMPETIRGIADLKLLTGSDVHHVAIANPRHAPYGRAAEAALRRAGMLEAITPKLVYGENVRQTFEFIVSGNAEAGLVSRSLAKSAPSSARVTCAELPLESYPPLDQAAVVTRHGAGNVAARKFIDFLSSPESRAVFDRYGFLRPSTEPKPAKVTK